MACYGLQMKAHQAPPLQLPGTAYLLWRHLCSKMQCCSRPSGCVTVQKLAGLSLVLSNIAAPERWSRGCIRQHTLLFLFSLAIMVANFSLLQARAQSASNMRSRQPAVSQKPRESDSRSRGRQMALCSTRHGSRTSFSSRTSSLLDSQKSQHIPFQCCGALTFCSLSALIAGFELDAGIAKA